MIKNLQSVLNVLGEKRHHKYLMLGTDGITPPAVHALHPTAVLTRIFTSAVLQRLLPDTMDKKCKNPGFINK